MSPRTIGICITLLVHLTVAGTIGWATRARGVQDFKPPTEVIEAQLAYLAKPTQTKQPQKDTAPPPPKPTLPDPTLPDQKPPKPPEKTKPVPEQDYSKEVEKYLRERKTQEDQNVSESPQQGEWDGSQKGFASVSKGPKFLQELAADAHAMWRVPSLERGAGIPIGCVRLGADGRIVDTKFANPSGNANIDRSVKLALKLLKEQRNDRNNNTPIPPSLVAKWTSQWTCFRFRKDQE